MSIVLKDYQIEARDSLKTGSVLSGGVGSGKSLTALSYYIECECRGNVKPFSEMLFPRDLYIITTAKKRDSFEWNIECSKMLLSTSDEIQSPFNVKVIVDSWNNIKKYKDIYGAFFIFDEQRIVGSGVWVKTFLNISRKNHWILLTATPGDTWSDYIPLFVANGFYKNKSEFNSRHCVYSRFSKYPKIERYLDEKDLENKRDSILVKMNFKRDTVRHVSYQIADYSKILYMNIMRERWNVYENEPIKETGELVYLLRKVSNSDPSRLDILHTIMSISKKAIVFYNFDYELEIIKDFLDTIKYPYSEWNGHRHQEILEGNKWVYLVQYSAGCEGWNCITCDTMIFFSQNYSYRMLEQACGRIDRMNTPFKDLYYYHIRSNSMIDLAIYEKLINKKNFNERAFISNIG